jgi:phosphoribosylanthranilate isomerase
MTRVKICGITIIEDALHAADCGVDAIGFNFYRGSKRYISPNDAAKVVEQIIMRVEKIGVFVNATIAEIMTTEDIAQLDAIQLHGDESPAFIEELRSVSEATIIKAVKIGPDFEPNETVQYLADAILLDAYSMTDIGGTGMTVDWTIAKQVAALHDQTYLAGGLTPENVAEAITLVRPYAVDVASGVELSPGRKDPRKVEEFIRNAKNA